MPSIVLHATNHAWHPANINTFATMLQALGLVGDTFTPGDSRAYLAGSGFLQLLVFLGCSPQITLDPADAGEGQDLCLVRLRSFDDVVFRSSTPAPKVRCRHCRTPAHIPTSVSFDTDWKCESCNTIARVAGLDWRQAAGYGRFFLEVEAVFPHEAVPADKLLGELCSFSGCEWVYFYLND